LSSSINCLSSSNAKVISESPASMIKSLLTTLIN
jgi:hypothetical protein